MKTSEFVQNAITGVLVLCAVLTTITLVRREFFTEQLRNPAQDRVRIVSNWRTYAVGTNRAGPANAPVSVIEFSDFQCPFCRVLASRLDTLRMEFPGEVTIIYRHTPLPIHAHAIEAARASECAADQGKFWELHNALFQNQDSIGRLPWSSFAAMAGVPNPSTFENCVSRVDRHSGLDQDTASAAKLGVHATPTILINEYQLVGAFPLDTLRSYARKALANSRSKRNH